MTDRCADRQGDRQAENSMFNPDLNGTVCYWPFLEYPTLKMWPWLQPYLHILIKDYPQKYNDNYYRHTLFPVTSYIYLYKCTHV